MPTQPMPVSTTPTAKTNPAANGDGGCGTPGRVNRHDAGAFAQTGAVATMVSRPANPASAVRAMRTSRRLRLVGNGGG